MTYVVFFFLAVVLLEKSWTGSHATRILQTTATWGQPTSDAPINSVNSSSGQELIVRIHSLLLNSAFLLICTWVPVMRYQGTCLVRDALEFSMHFNIWRAMTNSPLKTSQQYLIFYQFLDSRFHNIFLSDEHFCFVLIFYVLYKSECDSCLISVSVIYNIVADSLQYPDFSCIVLYR